MLKPLQDAGDTYILSTFSYNSADHASRDQDFRSQVNFLYPLESSLRLDFVKYVKLGLKNNPVMFKGNFISSEHFYK